MLRPTLLDSYLCIRNMLWEQSLLATVELHLLLYDKPVCSGLCYSGEGAGAQRELTKPPCCLQAAEKDGLYLVQQLRITRHVHSQQCRLFRLADTYSHQTGTSQLGVTYVKCQKAQAEQLLFPKIVPICKVAPGLGPPKGNTEKQRALGSGNGCHLAVGSSGNKPIALMQR